MPEGAASSAPDVRLEGAFDRLREAPCFAPVPRWQMESPFERPTDLVGERLEQLGRPIDRATLCTERSRVLNQLLYNVYEQNNLYLPAPGEARGRMESYYDPDTVAAGASVRPALERACFDWLEREIDASGPWTMATLREYLLARTAEYEAAPSPLCRRTLAVAMPERAAHLLLIQFAPDFLSEASQMARAMPGNFGPLHSELTKIFIDEFGYGVHPVKHSTLFERTLASVGLSDRVHAYYHWYLPTSLLLTSYFHYLTGNKLRWFEYLGALYWIEAVVPHFNRQLSGMLRAIFGERADTGYFEEHIDIDTHHRKMVLERLIAPTVDTYGPAVIPAMLRGAEASRLLGDLAERDLLDQIELCEEVHRADAPAETGPRDPRAVRRTLSGGQFLGPRVWDDGVRLEVEAGAVEVDAGYLVPVTLEPGRRITVPPGRMLGLRSLDGGATLALSPLPARGRSASESEA